MSLLLQNKRSIISVLAVRIEFYKFKNSVDDTEHTEVAHITDASVPVKVKIGEVYEDFYPLGNFLSVTPTKNELSATQSQVSIGLSGIPDKAIWKMLNNPIKNSKVDIYRLFYDTATKTVINTNRFGRFSGTVSTHTVEDTPAEGSPGTCTITLICNNKTTSLSRVNGRNNGPVSMKFYYPNDTSYDRIQSLVGTQYNFGAPKVKMETLK